MTSLGGFWQSLLQQAMSFAHLLVHLSPEQIDGVDGVMVP